jgi:branched-chain amino acid transport system substrate-binding protein
MLAAVIAALAAPASAESTYDPGASDSEIRIGNTAPYTGSFAEYSAEERAEAAYFKMMNDRGGIHGRKITFISVDDASDPRETVRLTRDLVERQKVLLIFGSFGTEPNLATRQYLNDNRIPQLFVQTVSAKFDDPAHFPWTMGFFASTHTEGAAYAKYILEHNPSAKIAVLYGAGASTAEFVDGVRAALGDRASSMIVKEDAFSYTDPPTALDVFMPGLRDSGADVFLNLAVGRYATRAIRQSYDAGWKPLQFIPNSSLSVTAFLDPAGLQRAVGLISNGRSKGWLSPESQNDPAVREFLSFMHDYNPRADLHDQINVAGYERAQAIVDVLTRCGDDLTRANVLRQATSMNLELGMFEPGIKIMTSPTDYQPIKQLYLLRFDGKNWVSIGSVTSR